MKAGLQLVQGEWQGREPAAADRHQEAGAVTRLFNFCYKKERRSRVDTKVRTERQRRLSLFRLFILLLRQEVPAQGALSSRKCCRDGNGLHPRRPARELLLTCGLWALDMRH